MTPWELSHGVGVGDFFDAEAFWSPERKSTLRTIHHAWPRTLSVRSLVETMEACPAFRHVEHKGLSYPTQLVPGSILTLRDQAICHRLPYYGSAFLEHPLDCEVPEGLPDRFAYIQPSTPKNGPHCDRWIRDEEWPAVIARLEAWDTTGLVVNLMGGKSSVPDHPSLIDWTGKASMPQSIEVLKRAEAFIGVDSCFAILAAQLFPADRLAIRSNNPFVIDRPDAHYPPHRESFPFLYPRFDREPYPDDRPALAPGTIVELRCNALVGSRSYTTGARVEIEPERAEKMLAGGQAVEVCGLEDD